MKCSEIQDQFSGYLENSLSEVTNSEIKSHLKTCVICNKELEELTSFLSILDSNEMETPSHNLRANFDKMLTQEIEKSKTKIVHLNTTTDWKSYLRVAASIVIVISAFLFGKYESRVSKIANSSNQNKAEVLALIEDTSASKRILAVTNAEEFSNKDTKIVQAIINRLLFDNNSNVRLAAAEALSKFSSEELVKDALIKSLKTDKNALVQIEVIQILAKVKEKRAVNTMKNMLENEKTPQFVKQQLKLNLSSLL